MATSTAPDLLLPDAISPAAALAAGKKVPPDVIELLVQDHRTVQFWFISYLGSEIVEEKALLAMQICTALKAHMEAEETVFYPAAAQATGERDMVERAIAEHQGARDLIAQIEAGGPADELMTQLQAAIAQHIEEEETELFPAVRASRLDPIANGCRVAVQRAQALSAITGKPLPVKAQTTYFIGEAQ